MSRKKQYRDNQVDQAAVELQTYRNLQFKVSRLKERRAQIEEGLKSPRTAQYSATPVKGGDKSYTAVDRYVDFGLKIQALTDELNFKLTVIETRLELIAGEYAQVLRMYFVEGYSICEISQAMNYSESWVIQLKKKALKAYAQALDVGGE